MSIIPNTFRPEDKIDNLGARALVIRDFVYDPLHEHTFDFDPSGNDKWFVYKNSQFLALVGEGIIIDSTGDDEQYKKAGILNANIDKQVTYTELINTLSEGEYKVEIQDSMIEALLRDLFEKFDTRTSYVDIFSFVDTSRRDEFKERTNGLLSLLRLEQKKKITIYDFGQFYEKGLEFPVKFDKGPLWQEETLTKRDIFLDETNGDVFLNDKKVGSIPHNTQPYHLFLYLYRNYNKYISHEEIYRYLKEAKITMRTLSENTPADIKRALPEGIKKLIKSGKKSYLLGSDSIP